MINLFRILALAVVLSIAFVGVGAADSPMPMENESVAESPPESVAVLDSEIRIVDWSYSDGMFSVTFHADRPGSVTVSEATQSQRGFTSFRTSNERIFTGETVVTVPASESGGEAQISITSSRSLQEGRGLILSTGEVAQSSPFERTSSTAGWFGGAGTVAFIMIVVVVRELRREPDAPEVAK